MADSEKVSSLPSPTAQTLTERLQRKCVEWGTYWRASDAHGVVLTHEQAMELLRDALGVEVELRAETLTELILRLHREGGDEDEIAADLFALGRDSEAEAAGISIAEVIATQGA